MNSDRYRRFNNTCIDCDESIIDRAARCRSCSAKQRLGFHRICDNCKQSFQTKRRINKHGLYFCSRQCRSEHGKIPCVECGKIFRPEHPKRGTNKFCSINCRDKYRLKNPLAGQYSPQKYICHHCGKEFTRYVSTVRNRNQVFCNMECKIDWWKGPNHTSYNSVDCVCEICGTPFIRENSKVEKNGGKYCSKACFSQSQVLPSINYYGPNWHEQRRKTRHRDKYHCKRCGKAEIDNGQRLDVHHIVPFRVFGLIDFQSANSLSNLISLCKHCHRAVEKISLIIN